VPELGPGQWAAVVVALLLVGGSKTSFSGLGVVAVALFALALPARESTGALLPLLLVGDLTAVAYYRRHADWAHLVRLLPWVALGVAGGAVLVGRVDDAAMRRIIGACLLVVLAAGALRGRLERALVGSTPDGAPQPGAAARARGLARLVGVLAGVLTMVANAAGPLLSLYLLAAGLPVLAFLGTSAWLFLVVNVLKVPFSAGLGLLPPSTLVLAAVTAPLVLVGAVLGRALVRRVDQSVFERVTVGFTVVAAVRLLL
jgi:uncharacterized membrane protein YfcA